MSLIFQKLAAGISAAVCLFSAVGSDIAGVRVSRGASSGVLPINVDPTARWGAHGSDFSSEQDTYFDGAHKLYNTEPGLHTDKTATAVDGRTFDLDLESWYSGSNPVDLGLVLDASGSMAWTTKDLQPLDVEKALADSKTTQQEAYSKVIEKYGLTTEDGGVDNEGNITLKGLQTLQEQNGNFLPEDVVELILDPDNTDDSKLDYNYRYYVYEDRDDVSEFSPLGFWQGSNYAINDSSLLGYYPFEHSLANEAPNAAPDDTATVVNGDFEARTTGPALVTFIDPTADKPDFKTVSLKDTLENCALLANVSAPTEFTIAFRLKFLTEGTEETPIVYIGDLNGTDYAEIVQSGSTLVLRTSKGGSVSLDFKTDASGWKNFHLTYDGTDLVFSNDGAAQRAQETLTYTFGSEKRIIIGGDRDGHDGAYSDIGLTDLVVYNTVLSEDQITELDGKDPELKKGAAIKVPEKLTSYDFLTAQYTFDGEDVETGPSLENKLGGPITLINQPGENGTFSEEAAAQIPVDAVYAEVAGTCLDLNATQKVGAVLLDAVPTDLNNFTVSFRLRRVGSATARHNLFYAGAKDLSAHPNDYFQFFRSRANAGYLELSNGAPEDESKGTFNNDYMYYQGGISAENTWYTNTLVFQDNKDGTVKVTPYIDGKAEYQDGHIDLGSLEPLTVSSTQAALLLGALLEETMSTGPVYVDDVYVFNSALSEDKVAEYFSMPDCTDANEEKKDEDTQKMPSRFMTHASDKNDTEFAQVTREVYRNRDKNRGWYYVNTASSWIELVECLHGEKQYMGWKALSTVSTVPDTATIPSAQRDEDGNFVEDGYGQSIEDGNTTRTFALPSGEQSNPFYVDNQGHLRTIVVTGTDDKHVDCSLVYENPEEGQTGHSELKYQTLNRALNEFFDRLYLSSGDSNVSVLRFSIEKMFAAQYNSERGIDNPETWLKHLAMKRWLNVGQKHGELKDLVTNGTGEQEYKYNGYMGMGAYTSFDTYNYVLTGGTNTWTGLRAFYEQNIDKYPSLKDNGHGKYLIVFTDGRDTSKEKNTNYYQYAPEDVRNDLTGDDANEAQLARLWANKIKEAGYTIYGVMLSTGSISSTTNRTGYSGAYYKLSQVVGGRGTTVDGLTKDNPPTDFLVQEGDDAGLPAEDSDYIKVATTEGDGGLIQAFQEILDEILKELDHNIVQDYIDPRFDLVDGDGDIYHLGPDGNVTVTDEAGDVVADKGGQVQSAIGCTSLEEAQSKGIPFTPRESRTYVNKEGQDTTDADPYLYYDSEKGMYYLRWYGLKIGGASQAFTTGNTDEFGTDENGNVYLSDKAWYSTIRIKAKEDFIGGNAILTNGNEPGMNLVFNQESIYGEDGVDGGANTPQKERETLEGLSGTDNAFFGTSNDINTTASKGFPRTTVNVQLLPINTKDLYDVVYLGEVIDPVEMLGEIEDDYLTDSYYLEYLKRYAARLYERQSSEDLIDLLNAWLQINQEGVVTARTFTIPYIYLPNPTYGDDGAFSGYANSFGAGMKDNRADYDDSNLRDIVGYLTYTWTREDKENDDPKQKFIVETTDRISYNLELQYTPLKQGDTPKTPIGDQFVPEGDKFFQVTDGEFNNQNVEAWAYDTRDNFNKALVTDQKLEPDVGEYYEWDSGYKPSVGTAQIDSGTSYGSATIENGESLVANTPYIKDPVNGALALEITINDTDLSILQGHDTEDITLPFTRTYIDPHSDNPAVSDTDVNADVTDEDYELTFTVDAGSAVDSATQSGKHTVIGVLSKIERGGQELTPVQLPIGTYTSGSCEGVMFCGRFLQIDGVETDSTKFKFEYFPKDVYDVNENAAAANEKADPEYLLNNNGTDYSPANMADSKSIQDEGQDTPLSGVFNLGTADSSGNKGKHLDADDENSREYTKDRLGILKLSTQGAQLPSAGGEGTFPIMLCGLALLAAGGTALLLRKRKARSEAGGDADG